MRGWLFNLPLFIQFAGIGALAMYGPAVLGFVERDYFTSRTFFYSGTLFFFIAALIGLALANVRPRADARNQLLALLGGFVVLPAMLAVPLYEAVGTTSFLNAYFEMVSALTTTGATLFEDPARLADPVHFWRAIVGWMGGFLVWVAAVALLAPMKLGGFEVTAVESAGRSRADGIQIKRVTEPTERVVRFATRLFPIYGGLTLILWIGLILAGDTPFVAICHAMSTLATSGISPVGGLDGAGSGRGGEILILFFLVFALSQNTFSPKLGTTWLRRILGDPELRIALFFLTTVPTLLFFRHWIGAYEIDEEENLRAAFRALWGSVFTVMSFLTTAGFESGDWSAAGDWSGLRTPGAILMGLAVIGGGVATTAGGVKLFRVYALYKHGTREMELLIHPSSVGGSGSFARQIRRQGAYIAWIFFMLFAISIAIVTLALTLTGINFEPALIFTVSSLSTTGPLAAVAGETALSYADLGGAAKMILAAAMVLGRLEALAIIALLNPDFWRP